MLATIFVVVAVISLSSCAGYTTNASSTNGGGVGSSGGGVLTPSPASIAFGNVPVGSTSTQSTTITNTGTGTASISGATISGGAFTIVGGNPTSSLPAGQSVIVQVQFAPTSTTAATGTVSVASNATNSTLTIGLSGTGTSVQGQISANPTSVAFGGVADGTTNSQQITLHNGGNATLTFSQITVSGTGFGQTGLSTSTTIAAGANATFNATFNPTSAGAVTGSIVLATNGTPSSLTINLSGTGQAPTFLLGANPTSLSFGGVLDQATSSLPTVLTNNGNSNITISAITTTGAGFSVSGVSNGTVLTPGQSVTLTVAFSPTSGGAVTGASASVASNATGSPMTITLSGSGLHSVALTWDASTMGGVTYNVFRSNTTGGEGTTPINAAPIGNPSYTDTSVTPGQNYFYTVEAVNSVGSSPPSNEVTANVPNP